MKHIQAHLKALTKHQKARATERGELMEYFCSQINAERRRDNFPAITMPHMGKLLEGIPTKDLYYLKRVCNDAKNFSKKFWWELKPRNVEEPKR